MGASYRSGSEYLGEGPSSGLKVDLAPNVVTPLTSGWAYSERKVYSKEILKIKGILQIPGYLLKLLPNSLEC